MASKGDSVGQKICYVMLFHNKRSSSEGDLLILNPHKFFIDSDKKLRMYRFPHGSTYADVQTRIQQLKNNFEIRLKHRGRQILDNTMLDKCDLDVLQLTNASRFQTKSLVSINNRWYACWFEQQQITFTDIMISIGKKIKMMPRHLFNRNLYCCGCGRKLSITEEPYQVIPAACCRVRSLRLTDRRVKRE